MWSSWRADVELILSWCGAHGELMWSWCGVDVELMLSWCGADVEHILSWCGADEELMWIWCGADVELMKSWCWADEELILSWCGADVKQMWSWCGALNRENGDLRTEMGTQKLKRSPWGPGPSDGDPWGSSVFFPYMWILGGHQSNGTQCSWPHLGIFGHTGCFSLTHCSVFHNLKGTQF